LPLFLFIFGFAFLVGVSLSLPISLIPLAHYQMKTLGKDVLLKNFIGSWQSIIGLLEPDYMGNKICCLFGVQLITDIFKLTDQSQMKGKLLGFTFKKVCQ
jgi:hypothetical protein